MKLWLDDIRLPPEGWVWAKTVEDAKTCLLTGTVEESSLDHDLGTDQPTGYDLCKWMAETGVWPKQRPKVHSANATGREAMEWTIHRYFPSHKWVGSGGDRHCEKCGTPFDNIRSECE